MQYKITIEEVEHPQSETPRTTARVEFSVLEDDAKGASFGYMIGMAINAFYHSFNYQGHVVDGIIEALPRPLKRQGD